MGKTDKCIPKCKNECNLVLEYQSETTFESFIIDMSSKINQEFTTFFHVIKNHCFSLERFRRVLYLYPVKINDEVFNTFYYIYN